MAKVLLRDSFWVEDYAKPYIVAEINSSHSGNVETAKEMAKRAKEVGCCCVKFQSWTVSSLYSKNFYKTNPIAQRIIKQFSLSEEQVLEIAEYCKAIGISFSSTPYSNKEVDFLVHQCKAPYIKVASQDISNYAFLTYIADQGIPVILSTGMAEMEEIEKAVAVIEATGNTQLILLHCISIYPAAPETINLNNILGLRERFPDYPVGLSDHTLGSEIASAAIALGAGLIEKHFTLDKSKMGMDNNMAIEPEEMAQLVSNCQNVFVAMGSKDRVVSQAEYAQRLKMRRSVIVTKDLPVGSVLTASDLDVKRPGEGLAPEKITQLIGCTLVKDVAADTLLAESDIKESV